MDVEDKRKLTLAVETALIWAHDHGIPGVGAPVGVWLYRDRIEARFDGEAMVLEVGDLRDFFEIGYDEMISDLDRGELLDVLHEAAVEWVRVYGERALGEARESLARRKDEQKLRGARHV